MTRRPGRLAIVSSLAVILGVDPLIPAVITVEGACSLVEAIRAAENDAPEGACPAGSGADTIVLTDDVTLNAIEEVHSGNNGLPNVTTEITIDGHNHTIARDPLSLSDFRFAYVESTGDLTLNRVALTGGRQDYGGSFWVQGTLVLRNSSIASSSADQFGGAIYNTGRTAIYQSELVDNRAVGNGDYALGGAIASSDELTIRESTLQGNRAGTNPFFAGVAYGGALWTPYSVAKVYDSTFSGNWIPYAVAEGGSAIFGWAELTNTTVSANGSFSIFTTAAAIETRAGLSTLTNVTLSGNHDYALRASSGGYFALYSTIVANTSGSNCSGLIYGITNNAADDATCGGVPSGLTGLDPIRADNGGPTETHALLAGSNAIDGAGFCTNPTDQRGAPRVGACDIGAYEYLGCPVLALADDTITSATIVEECSVSVGPNVSIIGPGGDLTVRFGDTATFGDGFSLESDAALAVEHDGTLMLVLPELIEADRVRRRANGAASGPPL